MRIIHLLSSNEFPKDFKIYYSPMLTNIWYIPAILGSRDLLARRQGFYADGFHVKIDGKWLKMEVGGHFSPGSTEVRQRGTGELCVNSGRRCSSFQVWEAERLMQLKCSPWREVGHRAWDTEVWQHDTHSRC